MLPPSADFASLEAKLGVVFLNKSLLRRALTHRSYINECGGCFEDCNERLEFLGDAVLELVISDYLFRSLPHEREGELTNMRSFIVSGKMAADCLHRLGLGLDAHILLSKGESANRNPRTHDRILADVFEALVGAIYLDRGYDAANRFIAKQLLSRLDDEVPEFKSAKCLLQEEVQAKFGITPTYQTLESRGPDHDKFFVVGAYLADRLMARGSGCSKKAAEQEAAQKWLDRDFPG